jgi:hypothetical protein
MWKWAAVAVVNSGLFPDEKLHVLKNWFACIADMLFIFSLCLVKSLTCVAIRSLRLNAGRRFNLG